ncbi:LysR family transcriptional regulator [Hirschia litorea]|uniref:LysR family transcriptional regulator n=1 Tax=Hirschia litorea TaxID=1199156 RepID=A0ABW2IKY0_9PROT
MLNPIWLNTFKTLMEVGHFTLTAEKLNMTQPGVSQHIKKLEETCGHTLLKRDNKRLELTEQGRQILEYASQLQTNETKLLEALNFDNPDEGICKLACSGSFALKLYPALLEIQKVHPKLIFELEVAPNRKILSDVLDGKTDLGVVTQHPTQNQLDITPVGTEELCLILPQSAKFEDGIAASIQSLGLIQHPAAAHYINLYFDLCGDPNLKKLKTESMPKSGYVNQLSQILLPISKGIGFTVLPRSALDSFPHKNLVHVIKSTKAVEETLYAVKLRNRQLPARYNRLNQLFKAIC